MSVRNTINLQAAIGRIEAATALAANQAAMHIHALALPATPFLGGDLRNSSQVHTAEPGRLATAHVSYGIVYAAVQHEKYPNKSHPGTSTKFLEKAQRNPEVERIVKATLAQHLGGAL